MPWSMHVLLTAPIYIGWPIASKISQLQQPVVSLQLHLWLASCVPERLKGDIIQPQRHAPPLCTGKLSSRNQNSQNPSKEASKSLMPPPTKLELTGRSGECERSLTSWAPGCGTDCAWLSERLLLHVGRAVRMHSPLCGAPAPRSSESRAPQGWRSL